MQIAIRKRMRRRSLVLAILLVILSMVVLAGGGANSALAGNGNGNGNGKPKPTPSTSPSARPSPAPALEPPSCGGTFQTSFYSWDQPHTCRLSYGGSALSVQGAVSETQLVPQLVGPCPGCRPDPYSGVSVSLFGPDGRLLLNCSDAIDSSMTDCSNAAFVELDLGATLTCSAQGASSLDGVGEYACSSI